MHIYFDVTNNFLIVNLLEIFLIWGLLHNQSCYCLFFQRNCSKLKGHHILMVLYQKELH